MNIDYFYFLSFFYLLVIIEVGVIVYDFELGLIDLFSDISGHMLVVFVLCRIRDRLLLVDNLH